jgi:uncharacterized protein YnzC (UPF0291/DUF896 family)
MTTLEHTKYVDGDGDDVAAAAATAAEAMVV